MFFFGTRSYSHSSYSPNLRKTCFRTVLPELNGHRDLQPQAAPLILNRDNLSFNGLSGIIAILLNQFTRKSPFQVHRVLGENDVLVLVIEGYPLAVDLDFGARNAEQNRTPL